MREGESGMVEEVIRDGEYSSEEFESKFTYEGADLGADYYQDYTAFRVWTPLAERCSVIGYREGTKESQEVVFEVPMEQAEQGTWTATVSGNLNGIFYTYKVVVNGEEREACDPYAKAVGVNGDRAMVIDLSSCTPDGWEADENPNKELAINDVILYELHIRDFSIDESSGIQQKGLYLGLTEQGTVNDYGQSTGLDYLKDLGITHVHLLPALDYGSVDETRKELEYNWGYDPKNYNVPEGSYASNPYEGAVRVKEMKQMVQALHNNGISVVLDVVYNHVYEVDKFCFNRLVPDYFSRKNEQGVYSNGSYCGNDTASERSMVHRYIVQSVLYWMEEYHIDGFRFDLVGLLDTDVINDIVREVHKRRPDVIFYGEGWNMPTTLTKKGYQMAVQMNAQLTPDFAYFNDNMRDLLRGKNSDVGERGYVTGAEGKVEELKGNIMGQPYWSPSPSQTVQYESCHDDLGLFDRIRSGMPYASLETLASYQCLAAAILLLSEGIPFLHAGEEFLRSKVDEQGKVVVNSYRAPDYVNSIKWNLLHEPIPERVWRYYKGLIAFRKAHPLFRLGTSEEVRKRFSFLSDLTGEAIGYQIEGRDLLGETAEQILVLINPASTPLTVSLPDGEWSVFIKGAQAGTTCLETVSESMVVPACSVAALLQGEF